MKRIIAFLVAILTLSAICFAATPFSDVKETDYFYTPVIWAVENGITNGSTPTLFKPTAPCSRAQVVTFLWRLNGMPQPKNTQTPFTDIDRNMYYYTPLCWAIENGITNGVTETSFEPERACTSGQLATFLWRAIGEPEPASAELVEKYDSNKFYSKASAYMDQVGGIAAVEQTFYPYGISSRGQIVTFMYYVAQYNK